MIRERGNSIRDKLEMLGQPFYTTKDSGTGLGLMVSYNIIDNHGGSISVESLPQQGTAFRISLPVITEAE
ncbi:ATP-binding protein [Paenibacillus apiarius]|uniref:ATP-binding protein n=1 Tax=Paenibacillus apiarius TaxID=46240 RepID=UPI002349C887|nr:ATP-binding protein [Paenibacillus apiarius]MEC0117695.1 ATP-binding protein [Paenibacillus apiarius]MEC0189229.1 ATP-binding protein [Paenibacillus apiarius]